MQGLNSPMSGESGPCPMIRRWMCHSILGDQLRLTELWSRALRAGEQVFWSSMNLDLLHLRPALPLEANICEYTNKGDFTCESEKQFDSTYQNINPHSILKTMAHLDILSYLSADSDHWSLIHSNRCMNSWYRSTIGSWKHNLNEANKTDMMHRILSGKQHRALPRLATSTWWVTWGLIHTTTDS